VPRWDNAPQAHSRVSNINFDIFKKIVEGVVLPSNYPKVSKNFAVLDILLWDIYRDPPPQFVFKYQS
jgi:hypothetical protein